MRRRGLLTRWELALGLVLLAAVAAYAAPVLRRHVLRIRRAEAVWVLDELLAAEQAAKGRTGRYFALAAVPRPLDRVGTDLVPWPDGLPADFTPPVPEARCAYWVDLEPALLLHAACDVDGDGVRARFSLAPAGAVVAHEPADVW